VSEGGAALLREALNELLSGGLPPETMGDEEVVTLRVRAGALRQGFEALGTDAGAALDYWRREREDARRQEREACAKVAEDCELGWGSARETIAAAIRARGCP
jgi:hypothetical protein